MENVDWSFFDERENMNRFLNSISFTKKEIKVIVFLLSVFISGFLIKNFKHLPGISTDTPYDYTRTIEEFGNLSVNDNRRNVYDAADSEIFDSSEKRKLLYELLSAEDSVRNAIDSSNIKEFKNSIIDPVNINTASIDELTELPGVGESTAEKIILYREEKNGFKKTDELLNIKGIGRKKFDKLKSIIKIE